MYRFLPIIGAMALLMGGCATPNRIHTTAVTQSSSVGVNGIVALRQQELRTTIVAQNSSAVSGQFGLIGSLIGSAIDASVNSKRAKAAEASAAHLRDALLDYAPADQLTAALSKQSAPGGGVQSTFVVRQVGAPEDPRKWIEAAGTDKVLLIDFDYALLPAYNGVLVSAQVTLHARKDGRPAKGSAEKLPPVIYQNILSTVRYFPSIPGGDDLAAKADALAVDHAKTVRATLDLAQQDMAALILYDLDIAERPENAIYKSDGNKRLIQPNRFNPLPFQGGRVERKEGNRVWIRSEFGDLAADDGAE